MHTSNMGTPHEVVKISIWRSSLSYMQKIYRPSQLLFGCAKGIASDIQRTRCTQDLFSELTIVVDGLLVSSKKLPVWQGVATTWRIIPVTPMKTNMIAWRIPMFNKKYIFKWFHFPSILQVRDCNMTQGGVLAHNWQWETASQILETFHLLVNITSREAKMGWAIHVKSRLVSISYLSALLIVGWGLCSFN